MKKDPVRRGSHPGVPERDPEKDEPQTVEIGEESPRWDRG
jgi:hypothetical protein